MKRLNKLYEKAMKEGQSDIRDRVEFKSFNQREFEPKGKFVASLIDVRLQANASMPAAEKYSVLTKDAIAAYEDIKKFAIARVKKIPDFKYKESLKEADNKVFKTAKDFLDFAGNDGGIQHIVWGALSRLNNEVVSQAKRYNWDLSKLNDKELAKIVENFAKDYFK